MRPFDVFAAEGHSFVIFLLSMIQLFTFMVVHIGWADAKELET